MSIYLLSKQEKRLTALTHAKMMVEILPEEMEKSPSTALRIAAIEAWFVNIRLISELFRLAGKESDKDFSMNSFDNQILVQDSTKEEFEKLWLLASQHVVHFSEARTQDINQNNPQFDIGKENLQRISKIASDLCGEFLILNTHKLDQESE